MTLLIVGLNDAESRKRVPTVAIDITQEDWAAICEFTPFLREASKETSTALYIFTDGHTPRAKALMEAVRKGPLAEYIAYLPDSHSRMDPPSELHSRSFLKPRKLPVGMGV